MRFGEKFAARRLFTAECVSEVGARYVLDLAKRKFYYGLKHDPEAIVAFDHTIKQETQYDFMRDGFWVRTEAIVLRAQLAIEGPKGS